MLSRKTWGLPVLLLMLLTGLVLAGCGSSDDGDSDVTTTKISGSVADAPIVDAKVTLYDRDGKQLAEAITGLGGTYNFSTTSTKNPFVVRFADNAGAAFMDLDGNGVQDPDDPAWQGGPYYTYVLSKGGSKLASGSLASTFVVALASALNETNVMGGTPPVAMITKARNMAMNLFVAFMADGASEVGEDYDFLTIAPSVKNQADYFDMLNSFMLRVSLRSMAKMAQGATDGLILPVDLEEALNDPAMTDALMAVVADLADGQLDGVMLPGAADNLLIPQAVVDAFAAASATGGDYAVWGAADTLDIVSVFAEFFFETPDSFKTEGFGTILEDVADVADLSVDMPVFPIPAAKMRLNLFPNRVLEGSIDTVDIEVLMLDANDTIIPKADTIELEWFLTTGKGLFFGGDTLEFYLLDSADTASAGNQIEIAVGYRANPFFYDEGLITVMADTEANRAQAAGFDFATFPCSIERDQLIDNCLTLSLIFGIEDLAGGLLDNQMITVTIDDHALFNVDNQLTKTVTMEVSSLVNEFVDICLFDNVVDGSSVLFDAALDDNSTVKWSEPVRVVDDNNKVWFIDADLISGAPLDPDGVSVVDMDIIGFDGCYQVGPMGTSTITLSVTRGSLIVDGTTTLPAIPLIGGNQYVTVTLTNGMASGTIKYQAPGADTTGIEVFTVQSEETNAEGGFTADFD